MRLLMLSAALLLMAAPAAAEKRPEHGTYELLPVDRVWSGHAVGFALEVTDRKLDTRTGWDSHNYMQLNTVALTPTANYSQRSALGDLGSLPRFAQKLPAPHHRRRGFSRGPS